MLSVPHQRHPQFNISYSHSRLKILNSKPKQTNAKLDPPRTTPIWNTFTNERQIGSSGPSKQINLKWTLQRDAKTKTIGKQDQNVMKQEK